MKITIEIDAGNLEWLMNAAACRHGEAWRNKQHARHIARTLLEEAIDRYRDDPAYTIAHGDALAAIATVAEVKHAAGVERIEPIDFFTEAPAP